MSFDWATWRAANSQIHATGGRTIWLFDKNLVPIISLSGALEISYSGNCNAPGEFKITLPGDHPAIESLLSVDALAQRDVTELLETSQYVVVEKASYRKAYRVAELELTTANEPGEGLAPANHSGTVSIHGIEIWDHVNHIPLWANPNSGLAVQLRYSDVQAGESLKVIKSFLIRNLAREFRAYVSHPQNGNDSNLPWWARGYRPRRRLGGGQQGPDQAWETGGTWASPSQVGWPIVVNPINPEQPTEWTVLDSRFNMAGDVFKPTLDAAGLQLTVDLWLPGDPQPFPTHGTLTFPTIVIDVVPRSFAGAATGTVRDVVRGVASKIADDTTTNAIVLDSNAFTGTNPHAWVVWDAAHMRGVQTRLIVKKATDCSVIVGGRSPQIVNHLVAAGSNALWSGIGAAVGALFPPLAGLAAAAGTFLGNVQGNLLKDKLFAWNHYSSRSREERLGRYRYRGIVKPGEAWSLSSLQAGFAALHETRGAVSCAFECEDGAPYTFGEDFMIGDQAAVRTHGVLFATYIDSVQVHVTREGDRTEIGLGDPRLRESSARMFDITLKTVAGVIDHVKTVIL